MLKLLDNNPLRLGYALSALQYHAVCAGCEESSVERYAVIAGVQFAEFARLNE
jgi:hypothetical protein